MLLLSGLAAGSFDSVCSAQPVDPTPSSAPADSGEHREEKPKGEVPSGKKKPNPILVPLPGDEGPTRGPAPPAHTKILAPDDRLPPGEKRPDHSFDGRPVHTTVGEDLLWIPRILFAPIYVANEYLIRKPIGAAISVADKDGLIDKITNVFTFGGQSFGLVPTGFIDFGFRPSIGLYFFFDDFLMKHDALRATISTGGAHYLKAKVAYRIPLGLEQTKPTHYDPKSHLVTKSYLQLEVDGMVRPDIQYFGTGWDSASDNEGVMEERNAGGGLRFHTDLGQSYFESWVTTHRTHFTSIPCAPDRVRDAPGLTYECGNHPITDEVRQGAYALPPGFGGYNIVKAGGHLFLDSRRPRPEPGSGIALDLHGELNDTYAGSNNGEWINFGGALSGSVDLTGHRRLLSLTLDARDIQTLGHGVEVPFTELIGALRNDYIPQDDLIRGFKPGRLVGKSSVTASLDYSWPIWVFVDATMQAAVGNVFDDHFEDFKFERLRFSFVAGFTSPHERDHSVSFLVGFGTQPFVEGGAPDSFRLLIGGSTGI